RGGNNADHGYPPVPDRRCWRYAVLGSVAGHQLTGNSVHPGILVQANLTLNIIHFVAPYSGPRKLDSRLSYWSAVQERGNDVTQTEDPLGGVQGADGPGSAPAGPHGERAGQPARRPPDLDPQLEEATPRRRRGPFQPRQQGSGPGPRDASS